MRSHMTLLLGALVAAQHADGASQCPDKSMGSPAAGQKLVDLCESCIKEATAAGCADPKFCPAITGEPWCGAAPATGCDKGAGALPGSTSMFCCQQYVNSSVSSQCGGSGPGPANCPDNSMSNMTYGQLSGAEVSELCDECFAEGEKVGCTDSHFCPELTGCVDQTALTLAAPPCLARQCSAAEVWPRSL